MEQYGPAISSYGLDKVGLANLKAAHWNLSVPALYEQALRRGEVVLSKGGAIVALTGSHTGRSPNDKFTVKDETTEKDVWWGNVNRPFTPEAFDRMHGRVAAYLQGRDVFVQDLYAGADPEYRLPVRIITQHAWHNLFAQNMFIRPAHQDRKEFEPAFTVIQVPDLKADPERDGTRSDVFVLVNFTKRLVLIGGTSYAGEIKKSIFGVMNYILPAKGVLPMHCSANVGAKGDAAVFFGLSGTGKTTLSADGSRTLIGDDEHGWSETSVFNFEGGCYAKVIRLDPKAEPEIYATTKRFGTVLENVVMDPTTGELDLDDDRYTENTRASYPLEFIPNVSETGIGPAPANIIMLTADAFGVLPPISKLTPDQAMYHFLSGYTARVAGTEKGVSEPQATFSTCFGAPFMPRHPSVYAKLLGEKIAKHGANCWLVNTGWSGGAYGTGSRMKIAYTRALIRAALEGDLASSSHSQDPNFGLYVPESCPEVPSEVLQPKNTWKDKKAYDETAREVARRFSANFEQFADQVDDKVKAAGINAAA
ncbi:MAG TPA: phosphoenolpyruvate carboxykinase [Azospirillaceae bacterium]|nr:phosphoenolpyruvate carboxykinase [Azospirillaceae bacterium]